MPKFGAFGNTVLGGLMGGAGVGAALSGKGNEGGFQQGPDPYGRLREPYLDWLIPQIGKKGPEYAGQMTAPMSEQEKASLGKVDKYANQGMSDTFKAGQKQITDTLGGSYDPSTSPYYQAVKAQSAKNLAESKERLVSDRAGAGRYWKGATSKAQGDLETNTTNQLNTILGALSQQERQNQLAVLPQAFGYGQAETALPLSQATALQTLGGLPRQIQQAEDTSQYNQFLKSQYDYPLNIAQLIAGVQSPPTYTYQQPQANPLMSFLGQAGGTALSMLPMLMMGAGCWIAEKIFGKFADKTLFARFYVNCLAPKWFRKLYLKYGQEIAEFIKDNRILKSILRPVFEIFAEKGRKWAWV